MRHVEPELQTLTVDSYGNQVTDGQPSTNQSSPTTTVEPTSTEIIDPVWFDPEVALGAMAGVAQGMTMVANHFTLNSYTGWLDDLTGNDINGAVDQWLEDAGDAYWYANESARIGAHALHAVMALESLEVLGVTAVGSTPLWSNNCFTAGTPVSTPSGLRSIETIDIGDEVWGYNLATERWESKRVLDTHRHESSGDFVTVHVAGDAIEFTYHHPYWVVSGDSLDKRPLPDHLPALDTNAKTPGRWVDAGDLRVGDVLLLKDGRHAPIEEIHFAYKTETVYNFQVADLHNYAVGQLAVLVHNNSEKPLDLLRDLPTSTTAQQIHANVQAQIQYATGKLEAATTAEEIAIWQKELTELIIASEQLAAYIRFLTP